MANTKMNRFSRWWMLLFVLFLVVALPIGWYLFSPIFIDQTVDESFPAVVAPAQATVMVADVASTETEAPVAVATEPDAASSFTAVEAEATAATVAESEAEPLPLVSGSFVDGESRYTGSGSAVIYQLADGQRVLRLEDFEVTNGPDLFVYLSGHPAPLSGEELHSDDGFEVARLKGNVGSQNYELPAELDLSAFQSVVIYCKRFSVVFSMAAFGG